MKLRLIRYCVLLCLLRSLLLMTGAILSASVIADEVELRLSEGSNLAVSGSSGVDLVLALQGTLYSLPAGGHQAHAITSHHEDAWEPAHSPDGQHLVYQGYRNGSWDLWELALEGNAVPRQLTFSLFDDREPQYLPGGRDIVFSSDRNGQYDLWLLAVDSGEVRALTEDEHDQYAPAWHPHLARLAFVEKRSNRYFLIQLDVDSGNREVLLESNSPLAGLQWHPDGMLLSYRSLDRDAEGNALTQLWLLSPATRQTEAVSAPGMDIFPFRAHWQDDNTMVFTADGGIRRWRRGEDITAVPFEVRLQFEKRHYARKVRDFDSNGTRPVLGISQPALSPEGQTVAFSALGDMWLWTPDENELRQLTDDPAADQMAAWSADGRRLAWVSDRGGRYRLWIYDRDAESKQALTLDSSELSFPAWSPDGQQLAYFTDVPGNPLLHVEGQLTILNLMTGAQRQLLEPMPPQPLNWSADGRRILTTRLQAFSQRYREGLFVLVSVGLDSGEASEMVPVAHRSIKHASYSAHTGSVAYIQDGVLNRLALDEDMAMSGIPEVLLDGLADTPHWSAGSDYLVFQTGDRLKRMHAGTGAVEDITPPLEWRPALPQGEWILRAGRLFTGESESYLTNVDVHIIGNRILAISDIDRQTELPVVDASDKAVVPGLFESHAHIGDHNLSEAQGRVWLSYGITSVRDPGSDPYLANERREAWASGRRIGPRLFLTGYNIDGNRVFYAVVEGISSDAHLEHALERSRRLQVDFFKTYVRLPDARQRRVVEFAHAMGVPVTSHELLPAALDGVDHIEHFTGTSRRGYATKISELGRSYQDVLQVLAGTGMGLVPTMVVPGVVLTFSEQDELYDTPQFNAFYGAAVRANYLDFMDFFGPGSERYVDAYGALLSELVNAGAVVGTGTDSPFTPFGTGLHAELRLYQREGLQPWQILQAATRQSAIIAGVEQDLGTLAAGKLADMVVIDGDPLRDIAELDNVVMTISNGRRYLLESLLATPQEE